MGRFIMVQVKSGLGNVHEAKNNFTYYLTAVHYEYYMRVAMPVILTLYIPGERTVVWAPINRRTVGPARLQWKLTISKHDVLQAGSTEELVRILDTFRKDDAYALLDEIKSRSLDELIEDAALLPKSTQALLAIAGVHRAFADRMKELLAELDACIARRLGFDSPQIKNIFVSFNKALLVFAKDQKPFIQEFVEYFSISTSAVHGLVSSDVVLQLFGDSLPAIRVSCESLLEAIDVNKPKIEKLLGTIDVVTKKNRALRTGRQEATQVVATLISELDASRVLVAGVISAIHVR